MDEAPESIKSPYFDKATFQRQIDLIKIAAAKADDVIHYEAAHDPEILRAIAVVEEFLRKKHRLCYGGQAINAHMPRRYKIYDPEKSVPDYDFFTPDQAGDIALLTRAMRRAGFTEISAREGIHEGTIKFYVNYNPVADVTAIDPALYKVLSRREFKSNGISYMDADMLRMMMYLELSRPMGEVTRWEKVYERLILLNEFVPIKRCHGGTTAETRSFLTEGEVETVMRKIITHGRIFAGGDLVGYYRTAIKRGKRVAANWLLGTQRPIFFYSAAAAADAAELMEAFREDGGASSNKRLEFKKMAAIGDIVPITYVAMREGRPAIIIIEETACHSYYSIPLRFGEQMRVASLDTLITLYFSLALLNTKVEGLSSLECAAQELVEISFRARAAPEKFPFPFISLKCAGHQQTMASLVREKVRRITTVKKKIKAMLEEGTPRRKHRRGTMRKR